MVFCLNEFDSVQTTGNRNNADEYGNLQCIPSGAAGQNSLEHCYELSLLPLKKLSSLSL